MSTHSAQSNNAAELYKFAQNQIREKKFDQALQSLEQSIAIEPTADALHDKGVIHYLHEQPEQAIEALKAAVEVDDKYHQAYANLGKITYGLGDVGMALDYMMQAANAAPDNLVYKDNLIALIKDMDFKLVFNEDVKSLVINLFQTARLNHEDLIRPWHSLFRLDPALAALNKLIGKKDYAAFTKEFEKLGDYDGFAERFVILGIQNLIIPELEFETFLTYLRRYLLENPDSPLKDNLGFICALGAYCFHTEYIFNLGDEEKERVQALKAKVEATDDFEASLYDLAILSCYGPLFHLSNAQAIYDALKDHDHFGALVQEQIRQPQEELRLRETIEPITPIDNATSQNVREQYEEFPYPRWRTMGHSYHAGLAFQTEIKDILIAGGGTGKETMEFALAFPEVNILCIDLSLSSLSYAKRKAMEMGIENVTFHQADILELPGNLNRKFDVISSSGVLQCMDNPEDGWRVLTDLLVPGGYMHIALYSETARRDVVEARRIIAEKNYGHDAEGMRAFRADCTNILDKKYMDSLVEFRDFFSMSECRDLIFHVKEHRHEIAQIEKLLADYGLDFVTFNFRNPDILPGYLQEYPDDPGATNLQNWAAYEQKYPRAFVEMYDFWSRKG